MLPIITWQLLSDHKLLLYLSPGSIRDVSEAFF